MSLLFSRCRSDPRKLHQLHLTEKREYTKVFVPNKALTQCVLGVQEVFYNFHMNYLKIIPYQSHIRNNNYRSIQVIL